MDLRKIKEFEDVGTRDISLLVPVAGLMILVVIGFFTLMIFTSDYGNPFREMYLMPWVFATGIVICAPSVYLYLKGEFNFFHPLVLAAWSYFFPAFFAGGLVLASGISEPYFLAFIDDQSYNLPLTLVYVMLGYGGLTLGYYLLPGRWAGRKIEARLPVLKWESKDVLIPGLILLGIGLANTVLGFVNGLLGYQKVEEIGAFDGILFLLTLLWLEASFLLWLAIFRTKRLNVNHYIVIGILLVSSLVKAAFQGNRGSLFQIFILIAFAFALSGRRFQIKYRVYAAVFITASIIIGMIYGTTFRNIKETEARVSMAEYTENIFATFEKLGEQDLGLSIETGVVALAERIEAVSSLAVVVANYEKLKPYEESYGLDNNIYKDSVNFFIPRIFWRDKPVASEPRKYGALYFDYGENSFTITPMGDLLRNFGPLGVPLGMILLGFLIRIISASLIENQDFSYWRSVLFYMLLTSISYESFYGSILPYLMKVGVVAVFGIFIIRFTAGNRRKLKNGQNREAMG